MYVCIHEWAYVYTMQINIYICMYVYMHESIHSWMNICLQYTGSSSYKDFAHSQWWGSTKKKFPTQRICWKKISHSEYLFKKESPWWHFIWMGILNADFNTIYLLKRYFSHSELNANEILTLRIHCKKHSYRENSLLLKYPKREYIEK